MADSMTGAGSNDQQSPVSRADEIKTFLLTTFLIIPGAAVGFVGAYGFIVWAFQMIYGPPGPPG